VNEALSAALAAEHAAIFAYPPIGVKLAGAARADARAAEAAHRARRDDLLVTLGRSGGPVPAAEPAYALPYPIKDTAAALRLAVEIEERAAAAWRAALPATSGGDRSRALAALTDCAVRATRWRRTAGVKPATIPFPGRLTR
jgi:hypothetical protein